MFAVAAAAALFASPAIAAQGKVPPYPEALRCAALSHAALAAGKGTPQESQLFDRVIYWDMAAADAGRAAGKTPRAVDGEVQQQAGQLQAGVRSGAESGAVAACAGRVPAVQQ